MKVINTSEKYKVFKPITLTVRFDTEEEAQGFVAGLYSTIGAADMFNSLSNALKRQGIRPCK